jgi:LPXTG-motif cell wall-anchored protein
LITTVTAANGTFHSADFTLTGPTNVTANFSLVNANGYATGCNDPNGSLVVRVEAAQVARQAQQAQALAFTGSNNTSSFALIGVAALVVGLVLTVGARRRGKVSS